MAKPIDAAQFRGMLRGGAVDADDFIAEVERLAAQKQLTPKQRGALLRGVEELRHQDGMLTRSIVSTEYNKLFKLIEKIDTDGDKRTITAERNGQKTVAGRLVDA